MSFCLRLLMTSNMDRKGFHMATKQGRNRPIRRREAEIMRSESIVLEMSSAVRFLGGDGPAKEQITKAAKVTRLSHTVIERLRWKKIKRVPADIADAVREAVDLHNEGCLRRARHEAFVAKQQAAVIAARLREIDPDFYGPEIDRLGGPRDGARALSDRIGGE